MFLYLVPVSAAAQRFSKVQESAEKIWNFIFYHILIVLLFLLWKTLLDGEFKDICKKSAIRKTWVLTSTNKSDDLTIDRSLFS